MSEYSQFFQRYLDLCKSCKLEPMSQKAAESWGVQRATISTWAKRGNVPKGDVVANIARGLNTSTDYLLGVTDKSGASGTSQLLIERGTKTETNELLSRETQFIKRYLALISSVAKENEFNQLWNALNAENQQRAIGYMTALRDTENLTGAVKKGADDNE